MWALNTESILNEEQRVQLKLLFDTMGHKPDGTISATQLKNATEWIYPDIFKSALLPYLFHKFHRNETQTQRINCDDFLYFMGYIWCIFQHNFKRRKANKMIIDSQIPWSYRFKSTLTPSVQSKLSASFKKVGKKKSIRRITSTPLMLMGVTTPTISSKAAGQAQADQIQDKQWDCPPLIH